MTSATIPTEGTRRRLDGPARRASILGAATSVFGAKGYAATSIADLAQAAGVSHLILYRHFESKHHLYDTVVRHARLAVEGGCTAAVTDSFGLMPAALLAVARSEPDAFTVLWRHAAREDEFRHHADGARSHLEHLTSRALRSVVPHAQLRWAARATVAFQIEAVLVWIEDGDAALDARFLEATEAAMRAGVRSWAAR